MQQFLYQYDLNPTTWVYLSSLLIIAIYFKFSRFWSIRNLDLLGLLALAPGLLMLAYRGDAPTEKPAIDVDQANQESDGQGDSDTDRSNAEGESPSHVHQQQADAMAIRRVGFIVLFGVGFLFLVRLLVDTLLVRRPLLEANLSPGGMAFLGIALFVFLMTNVLTAKLPAGEESDSAPTVQNSSDEPRDSDTEVLQGGDLVHRQAIENHPFLRHLPSIPSRAFDNSTLFATGDWQIATRVFVMLAHLTIVVGLLLIGLRHFGNLGTGIAMSSLYLLLPYTAQLIGRVEHILPPAFFVAAIVAYRRPAIAGFFLTSSLAVMLCPLTLFLFPLWISFYWQRGLWRFAAGVACGLLFLAISVLVLNGGSGFATGMLALFGSGTFGLEDASGFWTASGWYLRIPVGALVLVISLAMAIWPAQKNLGTLMACSAAIMLGIQFWYPFDGMMYVHWYLPLALLTVFRPNLENRVAIASLGQPWWTRKQETTPQAA